MTDPTPDDVAREIDRVLKKNPSAAASLGDQEQIQRTIQSINSLDESFQQRGGVFFHAGSNAFETAEKFTQIHVEQYRETGRPSLPALAVHHAEVMGIDKKSAEYKAMITVAVRAEMEASVKPDYHSKFHYMDVAAMTANLLEKNNDMVKQGKGVALTPSEQALTFISAIGHDLDHEGKGNPPGDPLFNEKKSFAVMEPLLRDAGLSETQVSQARAILMTTSPNGPHAILKTMAKMQREGTPMTVEEMREREVAFLKEKSTAAGTVYSEPADFTGDLKALNNNPKLVQMAAMVSDSDLYASGGAGMKANAVMSKLLTDEGVKYNNSKLDFNTDGSRKFFLDGIVGKDGFASDAGREAANDTFNAMRAETEERLKAAAAAKAAAEPPQAPPPKFDPPNNGGGETKTGPNTGGGNAPAPNASAPASSSGDGVQNAAVKTVEAVTVTTAASEKIVTINANPGEAGPASSKFMGEPKTTVNEQGMQGPHGGIGGTGAGVVGLVMSGQGLHEAIKSGDKLEMGIASANLATATAQTTESIVAATGESLPALSKATKFVPGLNMAATVVDGAYQISKEDTTQHKVERGTVVAATAATGLALGTATATAAEAAAVTTGVASVIGTGAVATGTAAVVVAAAPVVVTAAAVTAVAYTGQKAIEAKRAWDDVDRTIAENGAATKRQNYQSDDGKPSVLGFKHIAVAMLHHSDEMKNENMNGTSGLQRDQKGRFKIDDFKQIDMRDPKNIAELERVLNAGIAKEDKIIKDNDSFVPKGLRIFSSKAVETQTNAQMEQADLKGALQELQMYKKELKQWDAANPNDPVTTGGVAQAQPPSGAQRPRTKGPGLG